LPGAGPTRSLREEQLNALSHAIGAVASGVAAVPLLRSVQHHGRHVVISVVVYCLALVGVYLVSTMSHAARRISWRRRMRKWDQGLIYLLIVGTYTPLALIFLHGYWQAVTSVMWIVALAGFWSKVGLEHRVDRIAVALYLLVGWMPVFTLPQFIAVAPAPIVALMVAGGLVYSTGVALLLLDRHWPYLHTAWHVLVLVASSLHYWAIMLSLRAASLT